MPPSKQTELEAARVVVSAASALYKHWALCTCKSRLTTAEECRGCRLDRALDDYRRTAKGNRPVSVPAIVNETEAPESKGPDHV